MASITLDVTQDDIDHGVKQDCNYCPLALALGRLFPGMRARVLSFGASVDDHTSSRSFAMTKKAIAYVSRVDAGKTVSPARFQLRQL